MENTAGNTCYCVSQGVKVRKEKFGLLFYNSRDAKLTFVKSGSLLELLIDSTRNYRLISAHKTAKNKTTMHVVKELIRKGLIDGT